MTNEPLCHLRHDRFGLCCNWRYRLDRGPVRFTTDSPDLCTCLDCLDIYVRMLLYRVTNLRISRMMHDGYDAERERCRVDLVSTETGKTVATYELRGTRFCRIGPQETTQ